MTITLKDVGSGFKRTAIKENFDSIASELNDNVLRRDGVSGSNQLEVDIDMNSQRLLNLVDAINGREPVTLDQLNGALAAASSGLIAAQRELQTGAQVVADVTTFTGITYTLSSNNLYVFRNGNYQTKGVDYNETSTSSITWTFTPNATDAFIFITNLATTSSVTETAAVTHTQSGTDYNLSEYLQNRNVVNVKDFGAMGDGVTDDSAAFLAAKAAIGSWAYNSDQDGTIIIPRGTYYLSTGVDLSENSGEIHVLGEGQGVTHLIFAADTTGLTVNSRCSDMHIWSKPSWDASVAAGREVYTRDTSGRGITAAGRLKFDRLTVYGFGGEGIYINRMTNGRVENCRITGCTKGIYNEGLAAVTTTSRVANNYVTSCDIGYHLDKFDHSVYSNNIAELCDVGLSATSSFSSVWEKLYFEKNVTTDYYFLNSFPVFVGTISIVTATTPATSQNVFNNAVATANMNMSVIEQDKLASSHLGMMSYDNAASPNKGFKFNRFKMTGASQRFRGLRVLDRDTASGQLDAVGTFAMVNGAKAAHTSIVQVKADGTVLDSDGMVASVSKLATGEYSLNLASSTHPDHVTIATYQVYATGATPVRNAQWSMTSANLATHETGRTGLVQKIYVTVTDASGTLQDSGFTAEIKWNRADDLTS